MARQGRINWRYHTVGGRLLGFKVEHAPDQSPHGKAALCEGGVQVEPHTQAEHSSSGGNEPGSLLHGLNIAGLSLDRATTLVGCYLSLVADALGRRRDTIGPMIKLFVCYHAVHRVDGAFLPKCVRARGRWRPGPGLATCRSNLQVQLAGPTRPPTNCSTMGFGAPLALRKEERMKTSMR